MLTSTSAPQLAASSACESCRGDAEPLSLPANTAVLLDGEWRRGVRLQVDPLSGTIASITFADEDAAAAAPSYYLIPGLIDTHVHVTATTADLAGHARLPPSYVAVAAIAELRAAARRG